MSWIVHYDIAEMECWIYSEGAKKGEKLIYELMDKDWTDWKIPTWDREAHRSHKKGGRDLSRCSNCASTIHDLTSTLLHYISFEIWVVKYIWLIQITKGQWLDHLVGQLTVPWLTCKNIWRRGAVSGCGKEPSKQKTRQRQQLKVQSFQKTFSPPTKQTDL